MEYNCDCKSASTILLTNHKTSQQRREATWKNTFDRLKGTQLPKLEKSVTSLVKSILSMRESTIDVSPMPSQ